MGNLIPAFCAIPFALYGLWWMSSHSQILGFGFWVFAASPVAGWLGMNFFGLYRNTRIKKEMLAYLKGVRPRLESPLFFVGMATPKYASLLDPHEDVGYLILLPDRVEFFGDHLNLSIYRKDVYGVDFRMNPHSLVALGRWIAIEGRVDEQRIRLQIEPREKRTLLGNFFFGSKVKKAIEKWCGE